MSSAACRPPQYAGRQNPGSLPQFSTTALLFMVFCLLTAMADGAPAQRAIPLHNGDLVTITGKLKVERRGWSQFLVLVTPRRYRLVFNAAASSYAAGSKPQIVRELGLSLPWRSDLLAQHEGQKATATGTMQLEGVSPYYWNGALIRATEVTLADSSVETAGTPPLPPATLRLYKATVTLMPGVFAWQRSVLDVQTGKTLDAQRLPSLDGCALNGGGDVLNCVCTDGFVAVRGGMQDASGLKLHPVPGGLAQFALHEQALSPVTVQVECARRKQK